jgi:DNA (cytosine-5)-methyltransferase 1
MENSNIRFIDLFAGLGGIRLGFEKIFNLNGFKTECVMTSEIKRDNVKIWGELLKKSNFVIWNYRYYPCFCLKHY